MQQADTKSFFYEKHIKFLDSSDRISDYNAFLNYLSSSNDQIIWRNDWKVFNQIDGICFYKLKKDDLFNIVNISIEILIDSEMNVRIISEGNEAEILEIQWLLKDMKLEYWNQFHCLLDYYGSEPIIKLKTNPSYHVQKAIENLNRISSLSTVDNLINPVKTRLAEVLDEICFNKDPFLASDVKVEDMVIKEEPEYGNVAVECVMFEEPLREPVATFEDEVKKHYTNKAKRLKNTNKSEICKIIKDSNEESQSTQCQFCDKICKSRMHLHSHLHNAHVDPGCCDICGKVFKSKKRLKAHMTLHKERERAKCPHCGDEMLPQNLRRHIRVSHEGYKPFGCSICGRFFSNKTMVRDHEKIHTRGEIVKADSSMKFVSGCGLLYECPKCLKRLTRGGKTFQNHIRNCIGILTEKRRSYNYPCIECGKKFTFKAAAIDHMAKIHNQHIENVDNFCFQCKVVVDDYRNHIKRHLSFQCQTCAQFFVSQNKLDKHVEDKHEKNVNRPFPCEQCQATFKTRNHLRSHEMNVHTSSDEKRFSCDICNKRYGFKFELNTHMKQSHSDDKRYRCRYCGLKFKYNNAMKSHCRRDHGEKCAFPCLKCPEKMKTLNDLKRHCEEKHGTSINVQKYNEIT